MNAAARLGFNKMVLCLSLLLHLTPRFIRELGVYSSPVVATKSLLAGSRHSNQLARALLYAVLEQHAHALPSVRLRAWFDDMSVQIRGTWNVVNDLARASARNLTK
eukprot:7975167-Prorocentrum_lima.AAC.1